MKCDSRILDRKVSAVASRNEKVLPKIIGNILGTKVLAIPFPILFLKSIGNSEAILHKVLPVVLQYF